MGAELAGAYPEARETFDEADEVLGFELSSICRKGPAEALTETQNAQPALLAHSVAVARVLARRGVRPQAAAGHSLGEFSAHVVAGSLSFADGLRLVRARGEAMAAAGRERPGTMAALLGIGDDDVAALCEGLREEDEILVPANYNAPGQVVVSGSAEAVRRAVDRAAEFGARRAVELDVSGAFHSPLMQPAADTLERSLEEIEIRSAGIPVVANVDGEAVTEPGAIRTRLLAQLTAPVRWVDCVRRLGELGATRFLEPGAGNVLTGLLRRIDRGLVGLSVNAPAHVEEAVSTRRAEVES